MGGEVGDGELHPEEPRDVRRVDAGVLLYKSVVVGEPFSKANSRRLIYVGGRPRFILSEGAQQYSKMFDEKTKVLYCVPVPFDGDVSVRMKIYYATRRKDLDESLILDMLQGRAFVNDRQVKKKDITWFLDKEVPRCEIEVFEWR